MIESRRPERTQTWVWRLFGTLKRALEPQHAQTVRELEQHLVNGSNDERSKLKLAETLQRANDPVEAKRLLLEVAARFEAQGFDRRAAAVYTKVLSLRPDATTHLRLADVYERMERDRDAAEHLRQAEILFDEERGSTTHLMVLERLVRLNPQDPEALARLGNVAIVLGKTGLGTRCLERAAERFAAFADRQAEEGVRTRLARIPLRRIEHSPKDGLREQTPKAHRPSNSWAEAPALPSAASTPSVSRARSEAQPSKPKARSEAQPSKPKARSEAQPSGVPVSKPKARSEAHPSGVPLVVGSRVECRPPEVLSAGLGSPAGIAPVEDLDWFDVPVETPCEGVSLDEIARFVAEGSAPDFAEETMVDFLPLDRTSRSLQA